MVSLCLDLGNGAQTRAITLDGVTMFSAIDFVSSVCNITTSCAKKEFKGLANFAGLARLACFPGDGAKQTPVLTGLDLQRLLVALGDKVYNGRFREIDGKIKRLLGGDSSSIKNVGVRAEESGHETYIETRRDQATKKRKPEEEVELAERRNRANSQALANTQTMLAILERLRPGVPLDDRTVERVTEQTKAILLGAGIDPPVVQPVHLPKISDSEYEMTESDTLSEDNEDDGIRVSTVAKDINVSCTEGQLKEIGKRMAAKYREIFGTPPPKLTKRVGSRIVKINAYTEKDRAVMEGVIRGYMQV